MNLLMLTPSFHPALGGVEKHLLRVSQELVAQGHQVTVVSQRTDPEWPAHDAVGEIHIRRLPRRPGLAALRSLLPSLVEWADLVHCHDAYPLLRWYLPVRWMAPRRPAFITFHGYEAYPIPLQARLLRRLAERMTLGSICMGEFICTWYRTKCDAVSYGGVDPPPQASDPQPGAGAVFVGRLAPDSGIADIIQALRLLHDEHGAPLPLTVCGDGPLRAHLERAAREAHLQVRFLGRVPDVTTHLLEARFAFVTGYLAILEAMACRRLVFAVYDNPLKRDYLTLFPAASAMVVAGSPEELARRLAAHLPSPHQDRALLDQAEAFAREQTWRRVAETYLQLWQEPRS